MTIEQIKKRLNGRKIGLVIPCHNYGHYLTKCLDSVFNQTLPFDKVIVVNDSSTDNTDDVVKSFPQVIYSKVEFKHANKTRNHGVSYLNDCELLLLFDADNYMAPNYLQRMVEYLLENSSASYVYCDRFVINDVNSVIKQTTFPEYNAAFFEGTNFVDFASLMYKKVYDSVGGLTEEVAFSALEDWDFFYAAANMKFYGIHIPESLYYYREHPNSKSSFLHNHPYDFQIIKRRILERNFNGYLPEDNTIDSVSFVFAAKTEDEAQKLIYELKKQKYRGDVEFCYSTEGNIAHALNIALSKAKNDIIVFVETDVLPCSPDWLRKLVYELTPNNLTFSNEINHVYFNWAGTACYRKDLRNEKINESFNIAEDTEFFERLKKKYDCKLVRSHAIVYHLKEHETKKALKRAEEYGYLHAKLIEEYGYYPLSQYILRLETQKQIAENTLKGIKKYKNAKSKS